MNILENKRVIGATAGFALAFGGLVYFAMNRSSECDKASKEISTNVDLLRSYSSAELPPSNKTLKALRSATKKAKAASKEAQGVMDNYAAACADNSKAISPVELERHVRDTIDRVAASAESHGCTLAEPAKKLGMSAFTSASSIKTQEIPCRLLQFGAIERVVNILIDSGAASIEKVYCADLPEGYETMMEEEQYFPLSFEVSFTARRGVMQDGQPQLPSTLPRVINAVTSDGEFFIIPTGIAVTTDGAPPSTDAYQAPPAAPAEGQNFGDAEASQQAPAPQSVASRKIGAPDDVVRVHINFQVLYFTGQKH